MKSFYICRCGKISFLSDWHTSRLEKRGVAFPVCEKCRCSKAITPEMLSGSKSLYTICASNDESSFIVDLQIVELREPEYCLEIIAEDEAGVRYSFYQEDVNKTVWTDRRIAEKMLETTRLPHRRAILIRMQQERTSWHA